MRRRRSGHYRNIGLLILRVGLGIMFILHGYPKMFGGPEKWVEAGTAVEALGIGFAPMFFGFLAAVAEFFGGIFLVLGLFFRPASALLLMVMLVATAQHISSGDPFSTTSHSIELAIVFLSLLFIGPGQHSLDNRMHSRYRKY